MEGLGQGLMSYVNTLDNLAERKNPIKPGDFRDENGILHCGKCGAYMEHVQKLENIRLPPDYDSLDAEGKRRVDEMRNWLAGRRHRIPCRCKDEERRAYEREQKKKAIKENRDYCFRGAPEMLNCVFELDKSPEIWAARVARRYAENFATVTAQGNVLVFIGNVGHGKTFYACAIANKLLDEGKRVVFTSISKLIARARQIHVPVQSVVDGICENDLVILDDFGTEDSSELTVQSTYQIINMLYEMKKPLVITSNLSADKLKKPDTVDEERIYSRMLNHATVVEVLSPVGNRRLSEA